MNEIALELDSNQISLRQFNVDTFNRKMGLSLSGYDLSMSENYRINDFDKLQPFIITKP